MSVTFENISTVATSALVAFYNERTEKQVKKFVNRATAEARVIAILEADREAAAKPARTLSEAITESWKNPEIAAKRAIRNGVKADGIEYRSVREAFRALRLPVSKHIPFRMELKAAKNAIFEFGTRKVTFALIENA